MNINIGVSLFVVGLAFASQGFAQSEHTMDHSQHAMPAPVSKPMDHSQHQAATPAALRDPHAYSDGYDYGPLGQMKLADTMNFASVMVDHLEAMSMGTDLSYGYGLKGWWGRDFNRLAFKSSGEGTADSIDNVSVEAAWSRAIAAYWNSQLGFRTDTDSDTPRHSLALGIAGLAPYWFEVDANVYVDNNGRVAFRGGAEYEILFTQKLILQPMAELTAFSKSDVARRSGGGLSDLGLALRLRYEIRREFAPYAGVEWQQKFGTTADYARAAGEHESETMLVAGIRLML